MKIDRVVITAAWLHLTNSTNSHRDTYLVFSDVCVDSIILCKEPVVSQGLKKPVASDNGIAYTFVTA